MFIVLRLSLLFLYILSGHRHFRFKKEEEKDPRAKSSFLQQVAMVYGATVNFRISGGIWKGGLSGTLSLLYNQS